MAGAPLVVGAPGTQWEIHVCLPNRVADITNALAATFDPHSSKEYREEARIFLTNWISRPDAPHYGITLAADTRLDDTVRYWGLQALEHGIRYQWSGFTRADIEHVRYWVTWLADGVRPGDKSFMRNKIAQLWVDVAKRCWGEEWMDMDNMLVTLWDKPKEEYGLTAKLFVLYILERLSEEVMTGEDTIAELRKEALGNAINDIMVPMGLYTDFERTRSERDSVRSGDDGWLSRMCALFAWCLREMNNTKDRDHFARLSNCAVATLHALRPTMQWISLRGPAEVTMVGCVSMAFHINDPPVQTAAAELLHALLCRSCSQSSHDAWTAIMQQALLPESTAMIKNLFNSLQTAPAEDDEKYLLQKKLAELISILADVIALHPDLLEDNVDMPAIFELLQNVLQNKSLLVSIPVLHSWTKILACNNAKLKDYVFNALSMLVETCSERLLPYESLLEADAEGNETIEFLFDDFDTMPERHAFLGNYRRYCNDVIRIIARSKPIEALEHVLGTMQNMLQSGPHAMDRGFKAASYNKFYLPVLQINAQYHVVQSTLKGYAAWLADTATIEPDNERYAQIQNDRKGTMDQLQQWSIGITTVRIDNPEVAQLMSTLLVTILKTIKPETAFVLDIVKYLLDEHLHEYPTSEKFSEAVKSFEVFRLHELHKLALAHPDELLGVYDQLESRCHEYMEKHAQDLGTVWKYRAFLCTIIHRASDIERSVRMDRLREMLQPIHDAWSDQELTKSLWDYHSFSGRLDMGSLEGFYSERRFKYTGDWTSEQLDAEGIARQNSIKKALDSLPLRMTRCMLLATTDEIKSGTEPYRTASALWGDLMPTIIPPLLKMVQNVQSYQNMDHYRYWEPEIRAAVKRTFRDRFWQNGISKESKDEFYARVSGSRTSYEGFASVVRGTLRSIREWGFHVIYMMCKMSETFFVFMDLEQKLADALFADIGSLSPNHVEPVIPLMMSLVKRCPLDHRGRFLPPLLQMMFLKMDAKICTEWASINEASQGDRGQGDELGDEMRLESVLRELTHSMVIFVEFLQDFEEPPRRENAPKEERWTKPTIRRVVLHDDSVLEPMLVFCTHVLRMRDTRCCTIMVKILRKWMGIIRVPGDVVNDSLRCREYFATELLKACITSINEHYFADVQKELASLIAVIICWCTDKHHMIRDILLSLPQMNAGKVDKAMAKIMKSQSERLQRSLVLDLLDSVRGVSIHEAGKVAREEKKKKKAVNVATRYMEVEQAPRVVDGEEVGLESVSGMFADG